MCSIFPGAGLGAGFRQHAPGRDAPVPGKPRHPDEILHAHVRYVRSRCGLSEATLCRPCYGCYRTTRWMCPLASRPGWTEPTSHPALPCENGQGLAIGAGRGVGSARAQEQGDIGALNALLRRERPGSPATVTASRCGMPHFYGHLGECRGDRHYENIRPRSTRLTTDTSARPPVAEQLGSVPSLPVAMDRSDSSAKPPECLRRRLRGPKPARVTSPRADRSRPFGLMRHRDVVRVRSALA